MKSRAVFVLCPREIAGDAGGHTRHATGAFEDDTTSFPIDQDDARMADTVRRHGWLLQYAGGDERSD
jgi:hypothetical protein